MDSASEMLSTAEAAKYVGLSEVWMRQLRMGPAPSGPPFYRIGRNVVRYRRVELDDWLMIRRYGGGQTEASAPAPAEPPPAPQAATRKRGRPPGRHRKRGAAA